MFGLFGHSAYYVRISILYYFILADHPGNIPLSNYVHFYILYLIFINRCISDARCFPVKTTAISRTLEYRIIGGGWFVCLR